jgi:cholesterol transport system auxiliary component
MTMRTYPLAAAAAAAFALSGCAGLLGGGSAPSELLTLTSAETRPAAPRAGAQPVTIAEPNAPQALRTRRIPVYVDEVTIQYLQDATWVENPTALFARLVGETVAARTGRVVLDPAQFAQDPGQRVTGTLHRFGLDPVRMEVVVSYDAVTARAGAAGVSTNRFEARVPVAEASRAAVAPALNQAANRVAAEVADWVGR